MAPFSLLTYEDAVPWATLIKQRTQERKMPPWPLDKTVGIQNFKNDISLSDDKIAKIARWVDAGAPLGDVKDLPPAIRWPDFSNTWRVFLTMGLERYHERYSGPNSVAPKRLRATAYASWAKAGTGAIIVTI